MFKDLSSVALHTVQIVEKISNSPEFCINTIKPAESAGKVPNLADVLISIN